MEIKTKYNIGDRVWAIREGRAACFEIRGVMASVMHFYPADLPARKSVTYNDEDGHVYDESACYETKNDLLNSL